MKKNHFPFLLFLFCSAVQVQKSTNTLDELKVKYNPQNYSNQVLFDFQKTMFDLREKPELNFLVHFKRSIFFAQYVLGEKQSNYRS